VPFPGEHSCRLREPVEGAKTRRDNGARNHNGKKYDVIYQEQDKKWVEQAYRYPKETWTASEAGSHCKSHSGSFEAAQEEKKGEKVMEGIVTKETFSKAYPEIFSEIQKESKLLGVSEGIETGKKEGFVSGAEAERKRIKAVQDQLLPGHEALIETLKFDGKTTGPEAAVQVLGAEKALLDGKKKELMEEGQKPISQTNLGTGKKEEIDLNLPIEEKAKAVWNKDPDLRKEFGDNFDSYLAFTKASVEGRVKIWNKEKPKGGNE